MISAVLLHGPLRVNSCHAEHLATADTVEVAARACSRPVVALIERQLRSDHLELLLELALDLRAQRGDAQREEEGEGADGRDPHKRRKEEDAAGHLEEPHLVLGACAPTKRAANAR